MIGRRTKRLSGARVFTYRWSAKAPADGIIGVPRTRPYVIAFMLHI